MAFIDYHTRSSDRGSGVCEYRTVRVSCTDQYKASGYSVHTCSDEVVLIASFEPTLLAVVIVSSRLLFDNISQTLTL